MANDKQKLITFILIGASMVLALVGAYFGVKLPYPEPPTVAAQLDTLAQSRGIVGELSGDIAVEDNLTVGGTLAVSGVTYPASLEFEGATANAYETTLGVTDPTADRTINLPNMSGTVLVTNTPKILAFGTNTVTTTLTLSHGITGPTQVFCTLTQDSEANGSTCSATISSDTIVLKLWKADGATAGSVGKQIAWMVVGPGQ